MHHVVSRVTHPASILLFSASAFLHTHAQEVGQLKEVQVISTTPLAGTTQMREEIAANVQTLSAKDIQNSPATSLADVLNQNLGSVHIHENQGNPFQADVNYRGFTASPLLGTPQGLSVYMDGVRLNQPFGDVVSWDLIPRSAIQNVTLVPGSNPLFGLNTLGGAISLQTKTGLSAPGTQAEFTLGANNRASTEFQTGGSNSEGMDWFVLGHRFADGGWRDASSSDVTQLFSKLGWKSDKTDVHLTLALSEARLQGGGLQQTDLLRNDYRSVFTKPDVTQTSSQFLNLEARRNIGGNRLFSGNVYWRQNTTDTSNVDINEDSFNQAIYSAGQPGVANYNAGQVATLAGLGPAFGGPYTTTTASRNSRYSASGFFPSTACLANAASGQEPNEKCNALYNTTRTVQSNFGFSGQVNILSEISLGTNNLTLGAAYDKSMAQFRQASQFGYLNRDRSMTPVNAFADGTQNSENTFDQQIDLSAGSNTKSLFFTNTLSTDSQVHWTVAARLNSTKISNMDNQLPAGSSKLTDPTLNPSAVDSSGNPIVLRNSLTDAHRYQRLNPALGVSWVSESGFNPYASYSESSRAPTSIELGCADPTVGCRLPNSMAGDPYLAQVISRNIELGARGNSPGGLHWAFAAFRTTNSDDILFVANSSSTGYFKNFGTTQRQGWELSLRRASGPWSYGVDYTALDASYQSAETIGSPYNSAAGADGSITIQPGNRIPLMPREILKFRLNFQATPAFTTGLQLIAVGESYARGNENNLHQANVVNGNGVATAGDGKVPGYAVLNWSGNYAASRKWHFTASITNLLDQQYATAGALGPAAFRSDGGYNNGGCNGVNWSPSNHDGACAGTMLFAPGAPRTLWFGLRYLL